MQRIIPFLLLPIAALLPSSPLRAGGLCGDQDADPSLESRIEELARSAVAEGDVEGLALAIDLGDEPFVVGGWGHEPGAPRRAVDEETVFAADALAEPLVAAAILSLKDPLDLGAPLSKYLSAFKSSPIAVHHLLSHTSGLPEVLDLDPAVSESGGLLARLAAQPLEGEPGRCFALSPANVFLAERVLEEVCGAPSAQCVRDAILDPLDMEGTSLTPAKVHEEGGGSEPSADLHVLGKLETSVLDLIRFQRGLLGGEVGAGCWSRMTTPILLDDGTSTGRGYALRITTLDGQTAYTYGGESSGSSLQVSYYPSVDLTIALLASDARIPLEGLERRIARLIFRIPEPGLHDLPLDSAGRARYVGVYQFACTQVTVREEGGVLVFEHFQQPRQRLLYQDYDRFVLENDPDVRLTFELEEGRAVLLQIDDHGNQIRALRVG